MIPHILQITDLLVNGITKNKEVIFMFHKKTKLNLTDFVVSLIERRKLLLHPADNKLVAQIIAVSGGIPLFAEGHFAFLALHIQFADS